MGEPLDGVPQLDHAINAALLLGYVCLRTGDRVGLFGFDERSRLSAEPRGRRAARSTRLQATSAELDYSPSRDQLHAGPGRAVAAGCARRSLVVLLTDFVDTVTAELMVENVDPAGAPPPGGVRRAARPVRSRPRSPQRGRARSRRCTGRSSPPTSRASASVVLERLRRRRRRTASTPARRSSRWRWSTATSTSSAGSWSDEPSRRGPASCAASRSAASARRPGASSSALVAAAERAACAALAADAAGAAARPLPRGALLAVGRARDLARSRRHRRTSRACSAAPTSCVYGTQRSTCAASSRSSSARTLPRDGARARRGTSLLSPRS